MYAIVQLGSFQYRIAEGETVTVNRLADEAGKKLTLDKVLLYANGEDVRVGQPYVKDVKITAEITDQILGEKVLAFKFRKRKDSKQTIGHRKKLTLLNIKKIDAK